MSGTLKTIVFDAPDIAGLSAFYTSLAEWTQTYAEPGWITLTTDDGWRIGLQHAPDHVPPAGRTSRTRSRRIWTCGCRTSMRLPRERSIWARPY